MSNGKSSYFMIWPAAVWAPYSRASPSRPRISRQPSAFTEVPIGASDNCQRTERVELHVGPGVDVFVECGRDSVSGGLTARFSISRHFVKL
jgi:hypothetical protein